jgi:prophage antirepressor-like protein
MNDIFLTLDEKYIKFENKKITVIIDNDNNTWFNANDVAEALGYAYPSDTINANVDKTDKIKLADINIDFKVFKHPHSIYLSESGLYSLMLTSRLKKAKKFKLWITQEILPSIRKYGFYKMKIKYEKDYENVLQQINKLEKDNKHMKNDMKKEKFPNGGLVYIVDYTDEEDDVYRLGLTDNMNKRKKIYDTHTLHKKEVVYKTEISCPKKLEDCVRALLYDYRYKNRKDFFICKLSKIKNAFKKCLDSIKCIDQIGGETNEIKKLKIKSIKLINNINKLDKILIIKK